ncbi:hypothetical protein TNCV_2575761 [Trichonephila clavipes]|uniref:Uncharacterized protein n=1 Tax=Trichonephila clavipes TaxID=2585209 RepID=A0A8X6RB31_TRICX|nr:hypothetical protein TNCV_2575761 [Trichonephila clavipes]
MWPLSQNDCPPLVYGFEKAKTKELKDNYAEHSSIWSLSMDSLESQGVLAEVSFSRILKRGAIKQSYSVKTRNNVTATGRGKYGTSGFELVGHSHAFPLASFDGLEESLLLNSNLSRSFAELKSYGY